MTSDAAVQFLAVAAPARLDHLDGERDLAVMRELEGVGQQVLDDLLQPLRVGEHRARQAAVELHDEVDALRFRDVLERARDVALQVLEPQLAALDHDRARLDFREVENVVDEHEQVVARTVDGLGKIRLARRQVAFGVLGQLV